MSFTRRTYFSGTRCSLKHLQTSCRGTLSYAFSRSINTRCSSFCISRCFSITRLAANMASVGKALQTIPHCWLLQTLQTYRLRTNSLTTFSSREGKNSRYRRIDRSCRRSCCRRSEHPLPINRDHILFSPLSSLPYRVVGGDEQ